MVDTGTNTGMALNLEDVKPQIGTGNVETDNVSDSGFIASSKSSEKSNGVTGNGYSKCGEGDLESGHGKGSSAELVSMGEKGSVWWKVLLQLSLCFLAGVIFGIALEKSRVFEPTSIRYQFIYQKWIMLKVFLGAMATGLLCFGIIAHIPATKGLFERARSAYYACFTTKGVLVVCIGGFLLGAGMDLSAACPAMVLAQVGAWVGHGQALMTVFGCLVGAFTYGFCAPFVDKYMGPKKPYEKHLLDDYIKWPFATMAIPLSLVCGVLIFILEWFFPWRTELEELTKNRTDDGQFMTAIAWPPYCAGILIGLLQLVIIFTVVDTMGGSSSYTTVAAQVLVTQRMESWSPYLAKFKRGVSNWWQVMYVCGAIVGALVSALCSQSLGMVPGISLVSSFFGGFLMLFGARMGAGCTSGHGLSGTGVLALLSFLAVAMMFVGGSAFGFFFYALDVAAGLLDYATF
ncbi:thiosulfate transporter TsuA-like isoform X2 [Ptychodera flava]|uniref:thiosulfate transporter TsuA-like isoform X2 n=1 Tax=Ptychodera flava TaxID=63121 RepID=UPI003969CDDF